jgi:hypothetical protein
MFETIRDSGKMKTVWTIRKYASDEDYEAGKLMEPASVINGNLLLNEGITEALKLIGGLTADAFSNANAYIGVGDSNTAASASQTGLQAATNKTYKAMETSYPTVVNQTITFRSVFGSSDANYSWQEFTVINASTDAGGENLNRKVSDQGTKASGQTWTVDVAITLS